MKIHELLCEVVDNDIINILAEAIIKDCKPYLQQIDYDLKRHSLYRGDFRLDDLSVLDENKHPHTIPGHNIDRNPVDTPKRIHDYANKIFTQQFGAPFRNGLFVAHNAGVAETYGTLCQIYPIGDFKYLWSPEESDMYFAWAEFCNKTSDTLKNPKIELYELFEKLLDVNHFQYTNKNLKEATRSTHEIMLYCDNCYIIPVKNRVLPKVNDLLHKYHGI